MSYARRYIDVTFSGKGKTVTFNARGKFALRTSARIQFAGGVSLGAAASITLYGLSLDHINELSTFGTLVHPNYNYSITVSAGDDINGMSTVFDGTIQQAWADMKAMPNCPFHVIALGGGNAATMKQKPSSFEGATQVPDILKPLAQAAGLSFEDAGVQSVINDPYFWGSPMKQIREVIKAAGIEGIIQDKALAVWPSDGSRQGDALNVSPQTGLRDYPSFTEYGVQVRTEFRRALTYGGMMNITSDIKQACGQWRILRIDYDLQANMPGGGWYAIIDGGMVGSPVTRTPGT